MQIFLDDQPVEAPDGTLGAALDAGVQEAEKSGRIIVEVQADGSPVADEDLSNPPETDPYADELRMVSVEPRSFLQTTVRDAAEALEQGRARQREAGALIQTGRSGEAMEAIGDAIGAWQTTRRVVQDAAALTGRDPAAFLSLGSNSPQELLTDLARLLEELKRAMGEDDLTTAADVLAYDLDEQVDRWVAALTSCSEAIARLGDAE